MLDEHVIERQSQGKKDSRYELRMAISFPASTLVGKTQTGNDPGEELIEFQEVGECKVYVGDAMCSVRIEGLSTPVHWGICRQ